MTYSADLIATARKIATGSPGRADLNRAVSTVYYALFHRLCASFADIAAISESRQLARAGNQAYRSLDHGWVKSRCAEILRVNPGFPDALVLFARLFIQSQQRRNEADYSPTQSFEVEEVETLINRAEAALQSFDGATVEDRRAFAIFVALKPRRV